MRLYRVSFVGKRNPLGGASRRIIRGYEKERPPGLESLPSAAEVVGLAARPELAHHDSRKDAPGEK